MNENISTLKWLAALMCAGLLVMVSACKPKDSCNIPCINGVCVNNSCNCNSGFEGDSCTIRTTDKFIGSWDATDSCETGNYGYTVTIVASSSIPNQLIISNFGRYGTTATVTASISGFTFMVLSQNVQNNSITLSGSGTIDTTTNTITVSYTAEEVVSHATDACSGVWAKMQ